MTSTLHEAIAAARAGDMARAQMLAADVVNNNPDDPNGWYLLSQLVESDARRAAYLAKTLALDPNHPRARAEFAALPPALVADLTPAPAEPEPVVAEAVATEAVAVADVAPEVAAPETVATEIVATEIVATEAGAPQRDILPTPDEMIADYLGVEVTEPEPVMAEPVSAAPAAEAPEWLQPLAVETETTTAPATPAVAPAPAKPQPTPTPAAPRRNGGNQALSILLGLLGLLTLLVLAFLIYLLFF